MFPRLQLAAANQLLISYLDGISNMLVYKQLEPEKKTPRKNSGKNKQTKLITEAPENLRKTMHKVTDEGGKRCYLVWRRERTTTNMDP